LQALWPTVQWRSDLAASKLGFRPLVTQRRRDHIAEDGSMICTNSLEQDSGLSSLVRQCGLASPGLITGSARRRRTKMRHYEGLLFLRFSKGVRIFYFLVVLPMY